MRKKVSMMILPIIFALSLTACGGSGNSSDNASEARDTTQSASTSVNANSDTLTVAKNAAADTVFEYDTVFKGDNFEGEFTEPEESPDVDQILSDLTYTPDMLWGSFQEDTEYYDNCEFGPSDDFYSTCSWIDATEILGESAGDNENYEISSLPYGFEAGWGDLVYANPYNGEDADEFGKFMAATQEEYDWCLLYYAARVGEDQTYGALLANYTIEGTKVTFNFVEEYSYDDDLMKPSAKFTGTSVTYEFSRFGPALAFSDGSNSVGLQNTQLCGDDTHFAVFGDGQTTDDYFDNVAEIGIDAIDGQVDFWGSMNEPIIGDTVYGAFSINSDGTISLNIQNTDGSMIVHRFVYFFGSDDCMIFTDGDHIYRYTDSYLKDKYTAMVTSSFTDEEKSAISGMSEDAVGQIMNQRNSLLDDVMSELDAAGVEATVDKTSGEIVLDSEVLFDVDKSDLSSEGQDTLTKLMKALSKVVTKEEYSDFISQLVVQGHTDTSGDYDHNKELSEARAQSAMEFCLDTVKDDDSAYNIFQSLMISEGCSCDYPIYDLDGNEDMDASRRVVFLFRVNIDN